MILSNDSFSVGLDGVRRTCSAGKIIVLTPGESIYLDPLIYNRFLGEEGRGAVVVGEVTDVNDDEQDNRFLTPLKGFPGIIEDEPPLHNLCTEYPRMIPKQ